MHPQSLNLQLAHPEAERGPAAGRDPLGRLAQSPGSAQNVHWAPKEGLTRGLIQTAQELGSAHGGLGSHSLAVGEFGSGVKDGRVDPGRELKLRKFQVWSWEDEVASFGFFSNPFF